MLVYFNSETLALGPFLYFGSAPGQPLPSLESMKIAKHTKGNVEGIKAERPNIRVLNKAHFIKLNDIQGLYNQLFVSA